MRKLLFPLITPSAWDIWGWVSAPVVCSGVTVMAGYMQGIPWMFIWVGAILAGAGAVHFLFIASNHKFQRNPEHKLRFVGPLVGREGVDGSLLHIGFELHNSAVFPIEVEVGEMATSCENRIPAADVKWRKQTIKIEPGEIRFFRDGVIDVASVTEELMVGQMQFSLNYGHPGKRRYDMDRDLNLYIPLDRRHPFQHFDRLELPT